MTETRGVSTDCGTRWWDLAACQAVDPDVMFPDPGNTSRIAYAVGVCVRCPVRDACLAAAVAEETDKSANHRFGIRGGLTPEERYARYPGRQQPANSRKRNADGRPECGTPAAYARHVRYHEAICDECREAHNADNRARAAAKKAGVP